MIKKTLRKFGFPILALASILMLGSMAGCGGYYGYSYDPYGYGYAGPYGGGFYGGYWGGGGWGHGHGGGFHGGHAGRR